MSRVALPAPGLCVPGSWAWPASKLHLPTIDCILSDWCVSLWVSPHSFGKLISCHGRLAIAGPLCQPCKWSLLCLKPCIQFFCSHVENPLSLFHLPLWFFQEAEKHATCYLLCWNGALAQNSDLLENQHTWFRKDSISFLFIPDNANSI